MTLKPQQLATAPLDAITEAAIAAAGASAELDWKEAAYGVLRSLAFQRSEFSTDDIWFRLNEIGVRTPEPRAMGAVIRRGMKEELITWSGLYRKSFRRVCHRRPVAIWRSLVGPFSKEVQL